MSDWKNIPNVRDHISWKQDKGRMKLNYFLSIVMIGMFLNGYDGTVISGLQAFDSWNADLGYPNGTKIGLLNACSQFSGLVVGPIIQYIDDTFGRKWGIRFYGYSLLSGSIIGCVAGVGGANGYALFVCGRVLIGFGLASYLMTSLAVVQEITHPRTRVLVAHSWDSYWILGAVVASWVNFGCSYITTSWQWRVPYIIQVVPALYLLIAVQFVPETPRFLIGKGRYEEAFQFLVDYHANGDPNDPLVLFEFEEMKEAIIREREAKAETWAQICRQPANRHRIGLAALFMFCTSLSGSSIIYYYYTVVFDLVGITGASTQTGISAGLNMFTWLCQIVFVWVGKRVGRRPIMLWIWPCLLLGLIGMCVASAVATNEATASKSVGIAGVFMVWFYLGAFNCSNPVLYSYPAEVQTFSMRSKGLLVWNTCSQLFGAYTTWVDSIAIRKIGWKYYIVYMPLVVIQWVLMYIYMVETKGYTLEEIAHAFDGSTANLIPSGPYEHDTAELDREANHKAQGSSDSKDAYPANV